MNRRKLLAFIRGMGSVLDLWPRPSRYRFTPIRRDDETPEQAAARQMHEAWAEVGRALPSAWQQTVRESEK